MGGFGLAVLRPEWLWGLVLVPLLYVLWRLWPPPLSRRRAQISVGLRVLPLEGLSGRTLRAPLRRRCAHRRHDVGRAERGMESGGEHLLIPAQKRRVAGRFVQIVPGQGGLELITAGPARPLVRTRQSLLAGEPQNVQLRLGVVELDSDGERTGLGPGTFRE